MMQVYLQKPQKILSISQIKSNENKRPLYGNHSPMKLYRAENALHLQTNLRDQFVA